jgi:hypothetical protein
MVRLSGLGTSRRWAYLSAARSSKPTTDNCRRSRANHRVLSFSLRSLPPERTDSDRVDVALWHFSDMPTALRDVRFQGQSGKHMLTLSFSGFDPSETSASRTNVWFHVNAAPKDAANLRPLSETSRRLGYSEIPPAANARNFAYLSLTFLICLYSGEFRQLEVYPQTKKKSLACKLAIFTPNKSTVFPEWLGSLMRVPSCPSDAALATTAAKL